MFELCEFLNVFRSGSIPDDGFTVEDCSSYDAALDGFVLVCREHNVGNVKSWLKGNMRSNVEHCLKMFDHSPAKLMGYVRTVSGIRSYTEEMVKAVGGIQQFLDKYAGLKDTGGSQASVPESTPESVLSGEGISEAVPKALEDLTAVETLTPSGFSENAMNPPEPLDEPDLSSLTGGLVNTDSSDVSVSVESRTQNGVAVGEVNPFGPPMPGSTPAQAVTDQVEVVHVTRKVYEIQQYDPALIEMISDDNILESLTKLRELHRQIALDGLNPDFVLDDNKLKRAHEMLEAYPPAVFKDFVLSMIASVNNDIERIRVSSMLDDFVQYVFDKQEENDE